MPDLILIVDDCPNMRKLVSRGLQLAGYETLAVENAEQALEAWPAGRYAGVVTDLRMPGLDGVGLMERLRAQDPEIPILIMTGDPDLESARKAVLAQAADYILKPFEVEALVGRLGRAVESVRLKKENARLERRRRELQQLLVGEMYGPLSNLRLQLDVAAEEAVSAGFSEHELLTAAAGEVEQLWQIVGDLCQLDELARDELERSVDTFELGPLLGSAISSAQQLCRNAEARIQVDLEAEGTARLDQDLLGRVVSCLTCALLEASPAGGQIVVRRLAEPGLMLTFESSARIPPVVWEQALAGEDRDTITAAGVSLPTAIGLQLASGLARLLGGMIRVEVRERTTTMVLELTEETG